MKTLKQIFFETAITHTRDWTEIDYLIMIKIWKELLTQKRQETDLGKLLSNNADWMLIRLLEELQEE